MTTSAYHPLAELRSQIIHAYTDLLLHDMGEGLADNQGEGIASGAEWRTAPLWGLGHAGLLRRRAGLLGRSELLGRSGRGLGAGRSDRVEPEENGRSSQSADPRGPTAGM